MLRDVIAILRQCGLNVYTIGRVCAVKIGSGYRLFYAVTVLRGSLQPALLGSILIFREEAKNTVEQSSKAIVISSRVIVARRCSVPLSSTGRALAREMYKHIDAHETIRARFLRFGARKFMEWCGQFS